jgi:hypothetical protein
MRRLTLTLTVVLAAACRDVGPPGIDYLVLVPILDTLFVGDTLAPPYDVDYVTGSGGHRPPGTLVWSSGTPSVATVDPVTGAVIGVGPGSTIITARKGGVWGNAVVVVTARLDVTLLLGTIVLMPGDTMTVPVQVRRKGASPPAPWFEAQPQGAFTIDSATGRVTSTAVGGPFPFVVHADTVSDTGAVLVWTQNTTAPAGGSYAVNGTLTRREVASGEAVTYRRTGDGNLATRINLVGDAASGYIDDLEIRLQGALAGPGLYAVDSLSPTELYAGSAICRPPRGWALFSTRRNFEPVIRALSRQGGSLTVTRVDTVPGGFVIGGRLRFNAQRLDMDVSPEAEVAVRATFVIPLVTNLTDCS